MVTWASGKSCFTAIASRCAVEWPDDLEAIGSRSVTIATSLSVSMRNDVSTSRPPTLPGQGGLGESAADRLGNLLDGDGPLVRALGAVGRVMTGISTSCCTGARVRSGTPQTKTGPSAR